jgi:hypothetical protein
MHMEEFHDYTIHNGIGIRVHGTRACRVIRLLKGHWVEIGEEYSIPVEPTTLAWTATGIPATVLAVALRVYELDHPTATLRNLLAAKPVVENKQHVRPVAISPLLRQFAAAK